jgi:hypothetical protein
VLTAFPRDEPSDTRIKGIATAPAVLIARKIELCKNPVLLKKSSCWRGGIKATATDANTAHNGGFIIPRIRRIRDIRGDVSRFEGALEEGTLRAGKEVSDSLDTERRKRLSMKASKLDIDLLVEK